MIKKPFLAITLLFFCLFVANPVEASLTLGVVTAPDGAAGLMTPAQAHSFADLLTEKLQEDVVVKELADSATLINWLDRFAMLDLALLSAEEVGANRGRVLLLGQVDEQGQLNLVARQGISGDLPQRVSKIVRDSGLSLQWAGAAAASPAASAAEVVVRPASPPASKNLTPAGQAALEHVPSLTPGRAWVPQEESAYLDVLPGTEEPAQKLVLGVFPDSTNLLQTSQQAELLAAYLETVLPVSVKVREFTHLESFSEWFMRYRMVDLAVLPEEVAKDNLGRDYLPVAKVFRSDKPGPASAELVVTRRGQNEELQLPLQRVLLNMTQTADGQLLLSSLKVSEVVPAGGDFTPATASVPLPAAVAEAEQPPSAPVEDVFEGLSPPVEYAEPLQPVAPAEVIVDVLPASPKAAGPSLDPRILETIVVPTFPLPVAKPDVSTPPGRVEAAVLPAEGGGQAAPLQPKMPPVPVVAPAADLSGLVAVNEPPVAPGVVAAPVLKQIPELMERAPDNVVPGALPKVPVAIAVPPAPAQSAAPESVLPAALPVIPQAPGPQSVAPEPVVEVELPVVPRELAPAAEEPAMVTTPDVPEPAVKEADMPTLLQAPVAEAVAVVEVVAPPIPEEPVPDDAPALTVAAAPGPDAPVALPAQAVEPELVVASDMSVVQELEPVAVEASTAASGPLQEKAGPSPGADKEALDEWSEEDVLALLGEDVVASMIAQPDIPQELRPPGVPVVRPGRVARRSLRLDDELLLASMPEPRKNTVPSRPPVLLPEQEPEPGIIYVVPFVAIMVPNEVNARVFDQFVDLLNQDGESLGLQFVILKEGLQRVAPEWLAVRKYVTGELYAYVEDSGCCSTDLRTKARLTYHRPYEEAPAFGFEYPVKSFFEHDSSSIDIERNKIADDIAMTLAEELIQALQN